MTEIAVDLLPPPFQIARKQLCIVPTSDVDIKQNLLLVLDTKRKSVRINADCHAFLYTVYKILWWLQYLITCFIQAISTVLASIPATVENGCGSNIPAALINGISLMFTFLNLSVLLATKYDNHSKCYKKYTALAEELDVVLMRNDYNNEQLQQTIIDYSKKISKLINTEEPIPYCVKHRFLV
jgi:hypothetical protein